MWNSGAKSDLGEDQQLHTTPVMANMGPLHAPKDYHLWATKLPRRIIRLKWEVVLKNMASPASPSSCRESHHSSWCDLAQLFLQSKVTHLGPS